MRKKSLNSKGFGLIAVVIVIAVLVVLGGAGAYVYHRDHRAKTTATTGSTSSNSSTQSATKSSTGTQNSTATQQSYLIIKEWGVRLTLDSTTASTYYYISPNLPNVAYFSLKTISDIAPTCAADKGGLGAIARLTEAEQQSIVSGKTPGIAGTMHIGSYWYSIAHPQGACMDNAQQASVNQVLPSYSQGELLKTMDTLAAD